MRLDADASIIRRELPLVYVPQLNTRLPLGSYLLVTVRAPPVYRSPPPPPLSPLRIDTPTSDQSLGEATDASSEGAAGAAAGSTTPTKPALGSFTVTAAAAAAERPAKGGRAGKHGGSRDKESYHASSLLDRVSYLPIAAESEVPFQATHAGPTPSLFRAFIGQVRFETSPAQLGWLLQNVCGVKPTVVTPHRVGCFIVELSSEAELAMVLELHRGFLFDNDRIWIPGSDEESAVLQAHLHSCLADLAEFKRSHLPRGLVVVERYTM